MKKQTWLISSVVIVLLVIIGIIFLMAESPRRTVKGVIEDMEAHRGQKVVELIDENLTDNKQRDMELVVTDLVDSESVSGEIVNEEAWRLQDDEQTPTPKYVASNYRATVLLSVDGEPVEIVIRLRRQGATNEHNYFSYLFKPWRITNIKVGE